MPSVIRLKSQWESEFTYPFIKLKQKNYYDEVHDMLNKDIVADDTSKKDTKKFKKQYNSSKKIDV